MSYTSQFARRAFFDDFARERGFDPNLPQNWYRITIRDVKSVPGGETVVNYHNKSHIQALIDLYPTLKLVREKFAGISEYDWTTPEKTRTSMDKFARTKMGFDPLLPENWYSVRFKDVSRLGILNYYSSFITAIIDLYPDLHLDRQKFKDLKLWGNASDRRNFLDKYAKENGFDPLIGENWLQVKKSDVLKVKGAPAIFAYHNRTLKDAVIDLYPELHLTRADFEVREWDDIAKQRRFFEELVNEMDARSDFLHSLYAIKAADVTKKKGGNAILRRHGRSHVSALMNLFPELNLQREKFSNYAQWAK